MSTEATVYIDGAARGNPGPAAYALTMTRPGAPPSEEAEPMGTATNNVAEYTALLRALERASELGVKSLSVFSDSELIVKQMNGEYKVKNADLQDLYREAQNLRRRFDRVTLTHVRRADNKRADFLCNEALDGRPVRWGQATGGPEVRETRKPTASAPAKLSGGKAPSELEEEALALLNAARASWAAGREVPTPVEVWDRLWAMFGEHGTRKA